MRPKYILTGLLAMIIVVTASDAFAKRRILVYSGKLRDERARPIGGVFPLTFAFYNKSRGGRALWSEEHFVAVNSGEYVVELGRTKPIGSSIDLDTLYVGVRITGGAELIRERFVSEGSEPEEVIRNQGTGPRAPTRAGDQTVEYALRSGFAQQAARADDADRLEGRTLEQLRKMFGDGSAGSGAALPKLVFGGNTFNAPTAGGEGGTPYQQLCPDGYVVTGLRGGSGLYVDRVGIICSPLELQAPQARGR